MKNSWILVGTATTLSTQGFATNYADTCTLPSPCCEPKPCINCESFVPLYQPVEGCDTFVSAEALYWFAREKNLYYAIKGDMAPPIGISSVLIGESNPIFTPLDKECKFLEAGWSPGVRLGIGWSSDCTDWDLGVDWTYFYNQKTSRSSTPPFNTLSSSATESSGFNDNIYQALFFPGPGQSAIFNPWVNQSPLWFFSANVNFDSIIPNSSTNGETCPVFFQNVKASWRLTLNDIALDIGQTFWLREGFTFRPYAGVRGAWIKTLFQTKSRLQETLTVPGLAESSMDLFAKDRFIDRFWGMGIHLGIKPNWYFHSNWSIFGNFDAALIYGKLSSRKRETYKGSSSGSGSINATPQFQPLPTVLFDYNKIASKSSLFSLQPIFDLALGLHFEQSFCCGRYHSEIDLSWEQHIWLENKAYRFLPGDTENIWSGDTSSQSGLPVYEFAIDYSTLSTTLEYGGPIFRIRLDF